MIWVRLKHYARRQMQSVDRCKVLRLVVSCNLRILDSLGESSPSAPYFIMSLTLTHKPWNPHYAAFYGDVKAGRDLRMSANYGPSLTAER